MSQRSGRGGGVKPVGTKSQVYPKKLLDGSPYSGMMMEEMMKTTVRSVPDGSDKDCFDP